MDIGLELDLAKSDLDAIQERHRENVDKCFTEILDLWLQTNQRPTCTHRFNSSTLTEDC